MSPAWVSECQPGSPEKSSASGVAKTLEAILKVNLTLFLKSTKDVDESTSPLESGLGWTVKWQPEDRDFIGMGALISQQQHGLKRKFVGLTLEGKGIMRSGQRVVVPGYGDGIITSGGFSPTLAKSIAFARVPIEIGNEVQVEIRGALVPAKVGKARFVKHGQAL